MDLYGPESGLKQIHHKKLFLFHTAALVFFCVCAIERWRVDMTAQGPNHRVLVSFFVGRAQLAKGLNHYENSPLGW